MNLVIPQCISSVLSDIAWLAVDIRLNISEEESQARSSIFIILYVVMPFCGCHHNVVTPFLFTMIMVVPFLFTMIVVAPCLAC